MDPGFRFLDRQYQAELSRVVELRRCRADYFVTDTAERIKCMSLEALLTSFR